METKLIKVDETNLDMAADEAAKLLCDGEIVGLPTETVYGLAASALSPEAVRRVYEVKGRPQDNPIIVHISDLIMLKSVVRDIPQTAAELAKKFWPGPLTMVMEKSEAISDVVTCGMPSVAVRMPSHPVARAVIAKSGIPIAAPSANLSGRPSTTTARHVYDDLNGKIPLILDGGACSVGVESTVVSLLGEHPTILRPGIITLEELRTVLPDTVLSDKLGRALEPGETVESPGMKYKHYSPKAEVVILKGSFEQFVHFTSNLSCADAYALCFDGEEESITIPSASFGPIDKPDIQARRLFSVLRALDRFGASVIYARCPSSEKEGYAVYDRLIRAAGYKVVQM